MSSTGCDGGGGAGGAGATGGTGGTGGTSTGGTSTGGTSTGGTSTGGTSTGGAGGAGGTSAGGAGGAGGGQNTNCIDHSTFDAMTPTVSFANDVLPVFQTSCGISAACHGDPNAPNANRPFLGPNKNTTATADDIANIFAGIAFVPSASEPAMNRVTPGDPEHSFMLYKLDHDLECSKLQCAASANCGGTMPQGAQDPIPGRDNVRRWIAQGAKND